MKKKQCYVVVLHGYDLLNLISQLHFSVNKENLGWPICHYGGRDGGDDDFEMGG